MSSSLFNKILKYFLSSLALYYLAVYVILGLLRLNYAFELEWMEGGIIDHARRILDGNQLYAEPTINFVPFIYGPLYYYFSAGLMKIIGVGFLAPRLISYLASLGIFLFIFLLVKKETKNNLAGLLSIGLFAATYRLSGAFFDIARVDTLFVFFVVSAVYVIRQFEHRKTGPILGALLLSFGYLTKQQALPIALLFSFYYLYENRRQFLIYLLTFALFAGGTSLFLHFMTDGWYTFYVLKLPFSHPTIPNVIYTFWRDDLWKPFAAALTLILIFFFSQKQIFSFTLDSRKFRFYFIFFLSAVGGSYLSRLHDGGWDNVLMPAHAAIAVIFGISCYFVLNLIKDAKTSKWNIIFSLSLIIQFLILFYNPLSQLPTKKDELAGYNFINQLKIYNNQDVFVPSHGYLSYMAGFETYANWAAVFDILRAKDGFADEIKSKIMHDFASAIRRKKWSAIFVDNDKNFLDKFHLYPFYYRDTAVFEKNDVFIPVTGVPFRPTFIYRPGTQK